MYRSKTEFTHRKPLCAAHAGPRALTRGILSKHKGLFGDQPGTRRAEPDIRKGIMRTAAIAATVIAVITLTSACGDENHLVISPVQLDYSSVGSPRYSYAPYQSPSDVTWFAGQTYIGGDVEPQESLRRVSTTTSGTKIYMGAIRDGVGVNRLENYEADLTAQTGDGFAPFIIAPRMDFDPAFDEPENDEIDAAIFDSVRILNDALPPEFQIEIGYIDSGEEAAAGAILMRLESPESVRAECGVNAVACAESVITSYGYTRSSTIILPDDFDADEFLYSRSVIIHELLHALGIWGHVDSVEFPDSLMGDYGGYIPNVTHILNKIDREVLQIMYMSQESEIYNDWGEWSDVSHHLIGRTDDGELNFGVALFNGLPQPWVRSATPDTFLADNRLLSGTATWSGDLVAYSGPSPLLGDVELQVGLATLTDPANEQDLRFRDIFYVNRFESSDYSDTSPRWFPTRNLDYKVNVYGNLFANVQDDEYEEGWVAGAFMGNNHEHMAGTLKRTDMVGAFGGTR